MTKNERRRALAEERRDRRGGVKIEQPLHVCFNCARWVRHYVAADPWQNDCTAPFVPIDMGHCTYPQLKNREASDTCENFCTLKDMTEEELVQEFSSGWHGAWEEGGQL